LNSGYDDVVSDRRTPLFYARKSFILFLSVHKSLHRRTRIVFITNLSQINKAIYSFMYQKSDFPRKTLHL